MAKARAPRLDLAFTDGFTVGDGDTADRFEVKSGARLAVPTGSLIACDPRGDEWPRPFARRAPEGVWPVELSLRHMPANRDVRVAALRVRFTDAPVDRWELALEEDEAARPKRKKNAGAFPVNSGNACFFDVALLDRWRGLGAEERERQLDEAFVSAQSLYALGHADPAMLVGSSSGMGDGWYRCWWGLDAGARPICLAADFELLYADVWETLSLELGRTGKLEHPRLAPLDLTAELLPVWESRPFDPRTTLSLRITAANSLPLSRLESHVRLDDRTLPAELTEHTFNTFDRTGLLRRIVVPEGIPAGAKLELSLWTGTREL